MKNPNLVLVFHLSTDQITNGGRASAFYVLLGAQLFHRILFVFDVFGLDGQADHARLAVDADDLGFNFVAFLQHVARIFNAVTADFGSFQSGFDIVAEIDDGAFGVNFFHGTANDAALEIGRAHV